MKDKLGREIDYLRISVTKRCNLSCTYCTDKKSHPENELSPIQIEAIVKAFAKKGIKKVRLTGGEPLMREDLAFIAQKIKSVQGIDSLFITTNGVLLKERAKALKAAGVDGINISLDTLNRQTYKTITGKDCLYEVLDSLKAAVEDNFSSVKINSVLVRGRNDNEINSLIELAKDNPVDIRFIELMPFSAEGENENLMVTTDEILKKYPLKKCENYEKGAAEYYKGENFSGRVGFISPRSHKFCHECNRIRVLSDGKIKPCLGNSLTYDIRDFIFDEKKLSDIIDKAIYQKPISHNFEKGEHFNGLNLIGG